MTNKLFPLRGLYFNRGALIFTLCLYFALFFNSTYKKVRPSVKANRHKVSENLTFFTMIKGSDYQFHSYDIYCTCKNLPTRVLISRKVPSKN